MNSALLRSALLVALLCAASCATATPPPTPTPPPPTVDPAAEALAAYQRFWTTTDSALAAPGARDWASELEGVATGQALDSLRTDVENYAGLPAHTEGRLGREPVVRQVLGTRVQIVDCIDLGDSRLVSDDTGETLDDLANRVPRYRFRADVVAINGRWLVERTAPALDEPC